METKASHMLIGGFALATVLATFVFVVWIGQIQLSREFTTFDMYFKGSVSGLSVASDVRYNGISVGDVKEIHQDTDDPNLVLVRIEVDAETPVKEDTFGTMAFLGVTGVSFIELTGGSMESKPLLPKEGETYGVIQVQRSAIQELMETAPNIVAQSNLLLLQGSKLLSDENISAVSNTIKELETVMAAVAERDEEIGEMIASVATTAKQLERMSADIESLVASTNDMMGDEIPLMVEELLATAESVNSLATGADKLLEENQASITQFTTQGLGELNTLLAEARKTVSTFERLVAEIEDDPTILLGQEKYPEYEAN